MSENEQKPKKRAGGNAKSHTVGTADRGKITLHPYPKTLAIKAFCCECMGWESNPAECTSPLCALFPYRGRTQKTLYGDK